jgi:hypothetical protein
MQHAAYGLQQATRRWLRSLSCSRASYGAASSSCPSPTCACPTSSAHYHPDRIHLVRLACTEADALQHVRPHRLVPFWLTRWPLRPVWLSLPPFANLDNADGLIQAPPLTPYASFLLRGLRAPPLPAELVESPIEEGSDGLLPHPVRHGTVGADMRPSGMTEMRLGAAGLRGSWKRGCAPFLFPRHSVALERWENGLVRMPVCVAVYMVVGVGVRVGLRDIKHFGM